MELLLPLGQFKGVICKIFASGSNLC